MIQEKELKEIPETLDRIGITEPELWADIKTMEHGTRMVKLMRSDMESVRIVADLNRNENLGVYSFEGYKASVLPFPDIQHGIYAGIDTKQLDNAMKDINWTVIIPSIHFHEGQIRDILQSVAKLLGSGRPEGTKAGESLMLKHLSYTPLENFLVPMQLRDKLETTAFITVNNDNQDLDVLEAISVLSGRGVAKPLDASHPTGELCWLAFEGGEIRKFPDFDLDTKVLQLPFRKMPDLSERAGIIADLSKGNRVEGEFGLHGRNFSALYQADPVNAEIALFDLHNRKLELGELRNAPARVKELPEKKQKPKQGRGMKF